MTIFDDAKNILNNEIQTYQAVFDKEISDKLSKTSVDYDNDKKHFDNDLTTGIADIQKLKNVADWTHIKSRMNGIATPLTKSFDAWWNIMSSLVSDYVAIYYTDDAAVTSDALVSQWLSSISMDISLSGLKEPI